MRACSAVAYPPLSGDPIRRRQTVAVAASPAALRQAPQPAEPGRAP